jgi:hypothetical protein
MGQANSRQEAFWDACGFGRTHLVKKFIEEGVDINWVSFTVSHNFMSYAYRGVDTFIQTLARLASSMNVHSPNQKTTQKQGRKNQ